MKHAKNQTNPKAAEKQYSRGHINETRQPFFHDGGNSTGFFEKVGENALRMDRINRGAAGVVDQRFVRLAILPPDLQRAILNGSQSQGLTLGRIMDGHLPLLWSEQVKTFGTPTLD